MEIANQRNDIELTDAMPPINEPMESSTTTGTVCCLFVCLCLFLLFHFGLYLYLPFYPLPYVTDSLPGFQPDISLESSTKPTDMPLGTVCCVLLSFLFCFGVFFFFFLLTSLFPPYVPDSFHSSQSGFTMESPTKQGHSDSVSFQPMPSVEHPIPQQPSPMRELASRLNDIELADVSMMPPSNNNDEPTLSEMQSNSSEMTILCCNSDPVPLFVSTAQLLPAMPEESSTAIPASEGKMQLERWPTAIEIVECVEDAERNPAVAPISTAASIPFLPMVTFMPISECVPSEQEEALSMETEVIEEELPMCNFSAPFPPSPIQTVPNSIALELMPLNEEVFLTTASKPSITYFPTISPTPTITLRHTYHPMSTTQQPLPLSLSNAMSICADSSPIIGSTAQSTISQSQQFYHAKLELESSHDRNMDTAIECVCRKISSSSFC
jgi:hypothetical protein